MNPARRAGLAGAALVAAAVGAAAGMAAERVVVGRPLRRGETPGGRLGSRVSCAGRRTIVRLDDGVELHVEVDEAHASAAWRDLTVVFVHGYALNQDCFHYQRLALRGIGAAGAVRPALARAVWPRLAGVVDDGTAGR